MNYVVSQESIHAMDKIIRYFLERQKLVARAMLDIHPGPLRMASTHILGIEVEPYCQRWLEKIDTDENFYRNWQSGIWRDEWKHWAHGHGCRLTNLVTGEPIEWDAPDLEAFDQNWFWNHLEWRIQQTVSPDKIVAYTQWLSSIYQHMRDANLIVLTEHYKWKLTY